MGASCSPCRGSRVAPSEQRVANDSLIKLHAFSTSYFEVVQENPWTKFLTSHQLEEINQAFSKFDKNGDGHIESRELVQVMKSMGVIVTHEHAQQLIREVDSSGNGKVELEEFITLMARRMIEIDGPKELALAFEVFDTDQSGEISIAELRELMTTCGDVRHMCRLALTHGQSTELAVHLYSTQPLNESEVNSLIELADPEGTGSITREQFKRLPCWGIGELPDGSSVHGYMSRARSTSHTSMCQTPTIVQPVHQVADYDDVGRVEPAERVAPEPASPHCCSRAPEERTLLEGTNENVT